MEEFDIIAKIKHKNDVFLVLMNKQHIKYYLKVIGNKYEYPTLEEYQELKKIYDGNIGIYYNKINVNPLVKVKNKLVPLSLAVSLFLAGCSSSPESSQKRLEKNGIYISDGIITDDGLYNIEAIEADANGAGIIDDSYLSDFRDFPFKKICNPTEFSEMMNLKNVTYQDVKNTIINNESIDDILKDLLINGLNNLEKENFSINLGLLQYNIEHLEIIYDDSFDNSEEMGAYFDRFSHTVTINSKFFNKGELNDAFKHVIIHEVLGHGATIGYCENNGGIIVGVDKLYLNMDEKGNVIYGMLKFGSAFAEAIADEITCIATEKKLNPYLGYPVFMYYFHNLCSSNDVSYEDFANYGVDCLLNKMIENGVEDPQGILLMADVRNSSIQAGEMFDVDYGLGKTLISYYENKIDKMQKDGVDKEEIKEKINNWLDESENRLESINYEDNKLIVTDNLIIDVSSIYRNIDEYIEQHSIKGKR